MAIRSVIRPVVADTLRSVFGLSEGPELIINGTFDTDLSDWTILGGTPTWESGAVRFDAGADQISQQVMTDEGQGYRLRALCLRDAGAFFIEVGTTAGGTEHANINAESNQVNIFDFVAGATTFIGFKGLNASTNWLVDNVSVKET